MREQIIRYVTFNVEHCADWSQKTGEDLPVDVSSTAGVIRSFDPDTAGLQELYERSEREDLRDQTRKLASLTGLNNFAFAEGAYFEWKDSIGNGILTRHRVLETERIPVPAPPPELRPEEQRSGYYEDRVLLKAVVDYGGTPVLHLITHFGLNACEQENMVRTVCREIDKARIPVILAGDFNVRPDSEILQPISSRLINVARFLGNHSFTFASYNPVATLDYIFVSRQFLPLRFTVQEGIVSDHLACCAELMLRTDD